ncbi:MAG: hypothetical protein ABFD53_02960 [Anaerolineaceae bacterium]|jgi:hypothetical protein
MSHTLIIHIPNADPVIGEVDEIPSPTDNFIMVNNPRTRDNKDVPYLNEQTAFVLWPLEKLSFVEFLTSKGEEQIIGFVRE